MTHVVMPENFKTLTFETALLPDGWARNVELRVQDGVITQVLTDQAQGAKGCVLPGMANLHSHAHQRAMAGLAERSGSSQDSFWTWRTTMYKFLHALQPHQLQAIAAQLYVELLSAGYTRVAEFQYLHHQPKGQHYDNIAELSLQTIQAASQVGIGMTSLPVHYQFAGFGAQPISAQQQRFFNTPDELVRIGEKIQQELVQHSSHNLGVAGHSLRGTDLPHFSQVLSAECFASGPIHMHVAEQVKEIEDCLAWSGQRPVAYCLDNFELDHRWCLIHATHMNDDETQRLAHSGAVAGICPSTEANLGDGFFNATDYLAAGGAFGIGSDSHISTALTEELRWLEYGQRLLHKTRNQLAGGADKSTGRNLFELAARGGAQACAHGAGQIAVGQPADLVVLEQNAATLLGRDEDQILDSWIFSGNANVVQEVYVAGQRVVENGRHVHAEQVLTAFSQTINQLTDSL